MTQRFFNFFAPFLMAATSLTAQTTVSPPIDLAQAFGEDGANNLKITAVSGLPFQKGKERYVTATGVVSEGPLKKFSFDLESTITSYTFVLQDIPSGRYSSVQVIDDTSIIIKTGQHLGLIVSAKDLFSDPNSEITKKPEVRTIHGHKVIIRKPEEEPLSIQYFTKNGDAFTSDEAGAASCVWNIYFLTTDKCEPTADIIDTNNLASVISGIKALQKETFIRIVKIRLDNSMPMTEEELDKQKEELDKQKPEDKEKKNRLKIIKDLFRANREQAVNYQTTAKEQRKGVLGILQNLLAKKQKSPQVN